MPGPVPPGARDQAIFFLRAASEVEHAFVVQYLYASYSVDVGASPRAELWQSTLLDVARQEMGHLVTVQNLLLLLGATCHLDREHVAPSSGLNPFPLKLEPFSLSSLKTYLAAESPFDAQLPDDLDGLKNLVHHVGMIYAKLYWLFQAGDDDGSADVWRLPPGLQFPGTPHLKDEDFAPAASFASLLAGEEWNRTGDLLVAPDTAPTDAAAARLAAKKALRAIDVQGEGVGGSGDDASHYRLYLDIYRELTSPGNAGLAVAKPVAVNPATSQALAGDVGNVIRHTPTLDVARLFNNRYAALLLDIAHVMTLPQGSAARSAVTNWAMFEMKRGLAKLAKSLMTMPMTADGQGLAGPPFEPPTDPFPVAAPDFWARHLSLIDQSDTFVAAIAGGTDPALTPEIKAQAKAIGDFDAEKRRPFINGQLSSLNPKTSPNGSQ
jgi:hypothetical protein